MIVGALCGIGFAPIGTPPYATLHDALAAVLGFVPLAGLLTLAVPFCTRGPSAPA